MAYTNTSTARKTFSILLNAAVDNLPMAMAITGATVTSLLM